MTEQRLVRALGRIADALEAQITAAVADRQLAVQRYADEQERLDRIRGEQHAVAEAQSRLVEQQERELAARDAHRVREVEHMKMCEERYQRRISETGEPISHVN